MMRASGQGRGGLVTRRARTTLAWALAAAYVGGLLTLLLVLGGERVRRLNLDVYLWGHHELGIPGSVTPEMYGAFFNVLIFVPPALVAGLLWPRVRWWVWAAVGSVASALVELAQGLVLTGRQASLEDWVTNSLGALLGAGCALWLNRRAAARAGARAERQPAGR